MYNSKKKERVVFHYNKAHNTDTTIPTWVVKVSGQTFYVNSFISDVGFSTKETPDSPHTKGSLMVRGIASIVNEEGLVICYVK